MDRDDILDAFEMIAPPKPAGYVPVRKKWLFFDVKGYCGECGHETLRLAWPWKTAYEPRWTTLVGVLTEVKEITTDFGGFDIVYDWIEPNRDVTDPALDILSE